MRYSIAFQTDKPLAAYGPLAAQVEAYGFDMVTVYNDLYFQPAWLPLLEMARATDRIELSVAAVNPFVCHPLLIAGDTALLDEAAGGRATLGMARGAWLDAVGCEPTQPVTALREALACVRHLLRRDPAPFSGSCFTLAGGATLRWPGLRDDVPCLLGSWGPQTIRACIDQISAVKIGGSANPDVVPYFRRLIDAAAQHAGRDGTMIELVIGAVCVVDDDAAAARAIARREVALYLPVVADLDPTLTLDPALLERLRAAAARHDHAAAAALISDELLQRFAFAGAPTDIIDQAAALVAAGAQRVEFGTPHGRSTAGGLALLGTVVLPALRRQ